MSNTALNLEIASFILSFCSHLALGDERRINANCRQLPQQATRRVEGVDEAVTSLGVAKQSSCK
jgi:hypothetical protein